MEFFAVHEHFNLLFFVDAIIQNIYDIELVIPILFFLFQDLRRFWSIKNTFIVLEIFSFHFFSLKVLLALSFTFSTLRLIFIYFFFLFSLLISIIYHLSKCGIPLFLPRLICLFLHDASFFHFWFCIISTSMPLLFHNFSHILSSHLKFTICIYVISQFCFILAFLSFIFFLLSFLSPSLLSKLLWGLA